MPSQVMRSHMEANHLASIDNDPPGSGISQRENPLIRPDVFFSDVLPESVSDLLWNENQFAFLAAFGLPENQFAFLNISGRELQHLTDPHPTSGHEFHDQAIPCCCRPEDDLINLFLFQDTWKRISDPPVQFPNHGKVARIL